MESVRTVARTVKPIAETVCKVTMSVLNALASPAVPAYSAPLPPPTLPPRVGGKRRSKKNKSKTQKRRRS